jgi:hypothetical protein
VPLSSYRAAYVYQDAASVDLGLAAVKDAGLVALDPAGSISLSDFGRALMVEVRAVGARAAEGLWGTAPLPVADLADRCLRAAEATAWAEGAFHLVAPPYDEPGGSDAARLAERLTGLRWHRFDAHVAAWTAAGLTVEAVQGLAPGPQRDEIEASTNERAGAAYADLTSEERAALLEGLRGLA